MSDFGDTYRLTRGRFEEAVAGLSAEQLNWRIHPDGLTLGETALHVAGVEAFFIAQLTDTSLEGDEARLAATATEGVVNDNPFPFSPEEITPERIQWALELGREWVTRHIDDLTPELRAKVIKSALGPMIDGTGAFVRLSFHPGYHQGQAHLIRTAPGFPA